MAIANYRLGNDGGSSGCSRSGGLQVTMKIVIAS